MIQQQLLKDRAKALFNDYGKSEQTALSAEEARELVKYCLGIVHNLEIASPERLNNAKKILIEQGHKVPNLLPPALKDTRHLDTIVGLISEIVGNNTDGSFIDSLARNLAASLDAPDQREGAAALLKLERICGVALPYLVACLGNDKLYPAVSGVFKEAAKIEQHRNKVFEVLKGAAVQQDWHDTKPQVARNAAILINALAGTYQWSIGAPLDTSGAIAEAKA